MDYVQMAKDSAGDIIYCKKGTSEYKITETNTKKLGIERICIEINLEWKWVSLLLLDL